MPSRHPLQLQQDEQATIDAAVAGLLKRFAGEIPDEEIEATVRSCFASWSDARVKDFVPVLAERCARERLGQLRRRGGP